MKRSIPFLRPNAFRNFAVATLSYNIKDMKSMRSSGTYNCWFEITEEGWGTNNGYSFVIKCMVSFTVSDRSNAQFALFEMLEE